MSKIPMNKILNSSSASPSSSQLNNSFKGLIPQGVSQYNNFLANPELSQSILKPVQNRIPNYDSMYDERNIWGVNSPVNRLGMPTGLQPHFKEPESIKNIDKGLGDGGNPIPSNLARIKK